MSEAEVEVFSEQCGGQEGDIQEASCPMTHPLQPVLLEVEAQLLQRSIFPGGV